MSTVRRITAGVIVLEFGIEPLPMVAPCTADKTAMKDFSASLALELADVGIRARLVQPDPGATTRFSANGGERMQRLNPEACADYAQLEFTMFNQVRAVTTEADAAEAVWMAATEPDGQLRRPAAAPTETLTRLRAS